MHKYLVFDFDGTLAPLNKPTPDNCVAMLHALEEKGYCIILCSGKSSDYLNGYIRQIDLKKPVIISENGSTIYYGKELPPQKYTELKCSEKELSQIHFTQKLIREKFGDRAWMQPSRMVICVFSSSQSVLDELSETFKIYTDNMSELILHRHPDCIDILPKTVNKKAGLTEFAVSSNASPTEFIGIGDSTNDLPMFEFTNLCFAIGHKIDEYADMSFDDLHSALSFILENDL